MVYDRWSKRCFPGCTKASSDQELFLRSIVYERGGSRFRCSCFGRYLSWPSCRLSCHAGTTAWRYFGSSIKLLRSLLDTWIPRVRRTKLDHWRSIMAQRLHVTYARSGRRVRVHDAIRSDETNLSPEQGHLGRRTTVGDLAW